MKRNCISVSFVGVFGGGLPMIPQLDKEFCKTVFGLPNETISGLTPDGFVVKVNNRPFPSVVINTQRISFMADSNESLYRYMEAINAKFLEMGFHANLVAFGLNYDYEWLELDGYSEDWLWKRFVSPNVQVDGKRGACSRIALRFGINDNELVNIAIEPRVGTNNGIFASINHHHNWSIGFLPSKEKLEELYGRSVEVLKNKYFSNLIEKGEA